MGMAVVGEVEEGTAGEVDLEVGVGLEVDLGEEVMVAGGRLRLFVSLSFYLSEALERDMRALVSTNQGIPHESNA